MTLVECYLSGKKQLLQPVKFNSKTMWVLVPKKKLNLVPIDQPKKTMIKRHYRKHVVPITINGGNIETV